MIEYLLAFFGSFFAAILFNVSKKNLLWAGFSGMAGWIAYDCFFSQTGNTAMATFAGAIAVGVFSEFMARKIKVPATIFSVSGIFPIVPGISAYNTVQAIVENNLAIAGAKAVETITGAGALAFGIMTVTAVFRVFSKKNKLFWHASK